MIVLPTAIVGPPEAPELAPPARPTPVTWILLGIIIALALAEAAAVHAALGGWPSLPAGLVRTVTIAQASALLYPAPDLFLPHQLWTAALVADGGALGRATGALLWLWQGLAALAVLTVAGRAAERRLGPLAWAAALLVLAPLVTIVHLRQPDLGAALACLPDLVAGVAGLAWGLFAGHRVRWAAYYWLVVVVGVLPFRLHLRWLATVYVIQEAVRAGLALPGPEAIERWYGLAVAVPVGYALGTAARLLQRRGTLAAPE